MNCGKLLKYESLVNERRARTVVTQMSFVHASSFLATYHEFHMYVFTYVTNLAILFVEILVRLFVDNNHTFRSSSVKRNNILQIPKEERIKILFLSFRRRKEGSNA